MSATHPLKEEYLLDDSFELAKNISWVIKSLYGFGAVILVAGFWAASLASDVEHNTEALGKTATSEQLATVTEILRRVEAKIDKQDERQRDVKDDIARMDERLKVVEENVRAND